MFVVMCMARCLRDSVVADPPHERGGYAQARDRRRLIGALAAARAEEEAGGREAAQGVDRLGDLRLHVEDARALLTTCLLTAYCLRPTTYDLMSNAHCSLLTFMSRLHAPKTRQCAASRPAAAAAAAAGLCTARSAACWRKAVWIDRAALM